MLFSEISEVFNAFPLKCKSLLMLFSLNLFILYSLKLQSFSCFSLKFQSFLMLYSEISELVEAFFSEISELVDAFL